jgi:asparagine synthase (glutamine-hydrolysing)
MCGLAGFLETTEIFPEEAHQRISQMSNALLHRGPDAGAVWVEGTVGLGHRRLSIIDLTEAGAQPMHSRCGRYVIAFNGEIYNHLDLRRDLEAQDLPVDWLGHSDTETLLAAIVHWGLEEALNRGAGMFALALWDRREKRLFLARDRMGEKPLYWGWAGTALVFSSELKSLKTHHGFAADICHEAVAQYLRFAYVPAPRSIYLGIYKLEPGCILEVSGSPPHCHPREPLRPGETYGSLSVRRYWSLKDVYEAGAHDPIGDREEAVSALEQTLSRAIKRQSLSDVPLGAFLSGGVDSSTIVALMQAHSTRRVKTFTVGFEDAAFDESSFAETVARHLGTDHHALRVTDSDALAVIPELPHMYDEPFADSSQIPTHLVCRAARDQVTVALSGDGADELFGGYNRYFWAPRIWDRLKSIPMPVRRLLGGGINAIPLASWDKIGGFHNALRTGSSGIAHLGDKAHRLGSVLNNLNDIDDLYHSLVSQWQDPASLVLTEDGRNREISSLLNDPLPFGYPEDPAARMMYRDAMTYLPDDILCKVDRAAMSVSLETRVPFLDPEVITLAARIPVSMNIRGDLGKWTLRQVLNKYVPPDLIERPKTGFSMPIGTWLRGPLRDWAEELLSEERLSFDKIFDPRPIRLVWNEHLSGRKDWSARLWTILMFQAWHEAN